MNKLFLFLIVLIIPLINSCGSKEGENKNEESSGTPVTITHPFKLV